MLPLPFSDFFWFVLIFQSKFFLLNIWILRSIFWPCWVGANWVIFRMFSDIFWFVYYRTQAYLGTDLWVRMSVCLFQKLLLWVFWHFLGCSFFPNNWNVSLKVWILRSIFWLGWVGAIWVTLRTFPISFMAPQQLSMPSQAHI